MRARALVDPICCVCVLPQDPVEIGIIKRAQTRVEALADAHEVSDVQKLAQVLEDRDQKAKKEKEVPKIAIETKLAKVNLGSLPGEMWPKGGTVDTLAADLKKLLTKGVTCVLR